MAKVGSGARESGSQARRRDDPSRLQLRIRSVNRENRHMCDATIQSLHQQDSESANSIKTKLENWTRGNQAVRLGAVMIPHGYG